MLDKLVIARPPYKGSSELTGSLSWIACQLAMKPKGGAIPDRPQRKLGGSSACEVRSSWQKYGCVCAALGPRMPEGVGGR